MMVDLRSDTVTQPSAAMRKAMADAVVGDDVYGEDPTALCLESYVAELLGKQAGLFVPTGTMANQIALLLHCRRGDAVIVGEGTHCMAFESGAGGAWAGVQFEVIGEGGLFTCAEFERAAQQVGDLYPRPRLVVLENTHNRAGGALWSRADAEAVALRARALGLAVHLDGARLWNAAIASGASLDELAQHADTVSVCFSKGLGAPAGSLIAGPSELIREARRLRKMLGGGMRQVGVLCAAALYAVQHQRERLREDHALATRLARGLAALPDLTVQAVATNIVLVDVANGRAAEIAGRLRASDVLVNAVGPSRLRAVTHRDLDQAAIAAAVGAFARVSS